MTEEEPLVMTVPEAAQLARVGNKAIYRAVASGELYGRRIGKHVRIPRTAFLAWLNGEQLGGQEDHRLRVV
jgi:excisionase family DNA binding protein